MDFPSVRRYLIHAVMLCLDSDPSLIPASSQDSSLDDAESNDFRFWSEKQARRIAICIEEAFGIEFAPEVVLAEANVSALTRRILVSKEILAA